MKTFSIYHCDNDHINYVEDGEIRQECKICGASISMIEGVTLRAESEDELSGESSNYSDPESLLSYGVA